MEKEVTIYKDIEGNYDIDEYYSEGDLVALKEFLKSIGVEKIEVVEDEESIKKQRPFAYSKPRVMRKDTKRIDWLNKEVIVEHLCSIEQDDVEKMKELCKLSGFSYEETEEAKKPSGFISPKFSELHKAYDKWKRENKTIETPDTKRGLVGNWAEGYIVEQKKNKQKRVQIGTKVIVNADKKEYTVVDYDEENGEYLLEDADEFKGYYKRKEFEIRG